MTLAMKASWAVNIGLLFAKFVAFVLTGSKSVMAALADSVVDVLSQIVIALAEYHMRKCAWRSRGSPPATCRPLSQLPRPA